MPSWNIHSAHAEKLLADCGAAALGVADENAFLFGNFVPDIYVGYLVKPISVWIDYKATHLARKAYIPLPDYERFWRRYVESYEVPPEIVLGAWCHLVCDNVYNVHTRAYIKTVHVKPGERTRIGKQRDFAAFGRTLDIERHVEATPELIAQAAAFPQYGIAEEDVHAAVAAANAFVDENRAGHLDELPPLDLLTPDFFTAAFADADRICREGLLGRMRDS
ncbi:MAG: hypothetical protein IJG82_00075 [Atopobiaceae bacterium]|nr:hypothetical protein [Atopobiaceae bacterium]